MRKLLSILVAGSLTVAAGACSDAPTRVESPVPDARPDHSDHAAPRSEGTFTSTTWADGHLWQFQRNQPVFNQGNGGLVFLTPSDDRAQRPFYVIGWKAGDDGKQSVLFFDDPATGELEGHDHVTTAPEASAGDFKATAQLSLVLPGPDAGEADIGTTRALDFFSGNLIELVYAADVDGDGDLEDFTDVETVQEAWKQGLVSVATTFEETVLTLRDIEG